MKLFVKLKLVLFVQGFAKREHRKNVQDYVKSLRRASCGFSGPASAILPPDWVIDPKYSLTSLGNTYPGTYKILQFLKEIAKLQMTDTENTGSHENLVSTKRHQDVEEISGSQGHLQDGGNACALSVHFPHVFLWKDVAKIWVSYLLGWW